MTPSSFLLLSAIATGVVLAIALASRKPEAPSGPPPETTRWKRFRVHAGALHTPSAEPETVVAEEPGGLELLAAPRASPSPRKLSVLDGRRRVIVIARGLLFFRDRLRVLVDGRERLRVRLPRPGDKRPQIDFADPADAFEIQGNVPAREFEVRRKGRLVASVSWQRPEGAPPRKDYLLESLKEEDPMPIVALVLAVEAAMGPAKA